MIKGWKTQMQSYWNLPEDIMVDIFIRLPVESIGRCRCVSKPWRDLLTRPKFIRDHLNQSKKSQRESIVLTTLNTTHEHVFFISLSNSHHQFDKITIPLTQLRSAANYASWISCSCDGLLLLRNGDDEIVLNPVTRETNRVSPMPFDTKSPKYADLYGFGYDSVSDDYKIVAISYKKVDYSYHRCGCNCCSHMLVHVYSLKRSDSWKRVASPPYKEAISTHSLGLVVDGCVHWIAKRTADSKVVIVAFDLAEEKFREMHPPSSVDFRKRECARLALLDGCLCFFRRNGTDVWVMKEYGIQESWTKFAVDAPSTVLTMPMCMFGPEQVVFLNSDDVLVMYNLEEQTLKDIVLPGVPDNLRVRGSFVESLVSPRLI